MLLARPQIEAVFIALLILHNEEECVPRYHRAGWATKTSASYSTYQALQGCPGFDEWWEEQRVHFLRDGAPLAVIDSRVNRGRCAIGRCRCPGRSSKTTCWPVLGSRASRPLYRRWKIACDPVHFGLPILAAKTFLRGGPVDNVTDIERAHYLTGDVHHNSLIRSMVALITCSTAIAIGRFEDDQILRGYCTRAWEPLANRVPAAIPWPDGHDRGESTHRSARLHMRGRDALARVTVAEADAARRTHARSTLVETLISLVSARMICVAPESETP